jgi:hypothetical protein
MITIPYSASLKVRVDVEEQHAALTPKDERNEL